jgi:hypothetical protein
MAHELYDTMMQIDGFYAQWKGLNPELGPKALEAKFVRRNLGQLLPQARAALAAMLRTCPDPNLCETIYEALILDHTLIRGRTTHVS